MSKMHWGLIAAVIIAYFVGAKWPVLAQKTGLV